MKSIKIANIYLLHEHEGLLVIGNNSQKWKAYYKLTLFAGLAPKENLIIKPAADLR